MTSLEKQLRKIVRDRIKQGFRFVRSPYFYEGGNIFPFCGCILGAVSGSVDNEKEHYTTVAARRLGCSDEEAQAIESGYMGWDSLYVGFIDHESMGDRLRMYAESLQKVPINE